MSLILTLLTSNAMTFSHFELWLKCPNYYFFFAPEYFVYTFMEIMMLFPMLRINWTYASYFCYEFLMMIVSSPLTKVSEGENTHWKQEGIKRERNRFDISLINPSARKPRLKRHCNWIRITHNAHHGHNLEQEDVMHTNMPIYTDLTSAVPC